MNGINAMVRQLNDAQSLMPKRKMGRFEARNRLVKFSDDVIGMYKTGASTRTIAAKYKVSRLTVETFLKRRGVFKSKVVIVDRKTKLEAVRKRKAGALIRDLAEEYSIAQSTVSKWVSQHKEGKL